MIKKYNFYFFIFALFLLIWGVCTLFAESNNGQHENDIKSVAGSSLEVNENKGKGFGAEGEEDEKSTDTPLGVDYSAERERDLTITDEGFEDSTEDTSGGKKSSIEEGLKDTPSETSEASEPSFFSIQAGGLTMADGDRWYFEEYDENGNVVNTVSYKNTKMLSKSTIEYDNNKKVSAVFVEPKKIIKVRYDAKGVEIAREEFRNKKGEVGKSISSSENVYSKDGRLKEETHIENGIEIRKVYTYKEGKKFTETVYESGIKTVFIEYGESSKLVHIFNGENEVSVFEEEIEG